jgi:hypothetical protein
MRRTLLAVATTVTLAVSAGPAHAHGQTVEPPGQDGPVVSGPISNPWAQAHCHSAAPAVHADHAVVTFTPAEGKPCLDSTVNPGGQVHPNAVPAP